MLNAELIAKAKKAGSAEELLCVLKEMGAETEEESARELFDRLGRLSDDELEGIAAGVVGPVRSGHSSFMEHILNKNGISKNDQQ